jgi:two-component sensor histidine kinase
MFIKFITTVLFLLIAFMANGQLERRNRLTARQLADLVSLVHKKTDDATRFRLQIRLAKHMFEKGLIGKADIDSVGFLIRQAKEINASSLAGKENGLILLYEATLARRNGSPDSATKLLRQAISKFKSSNDNFRLAEAYLQLSRNYDTNDPKQAAAVRGQIDTLFRIVPRLIPHRELDSCMATVRNFFDLYMYTDNQKMQMYFLDQFAAACQVLNDKSRQLWARRGKALLHYYQGHLDTAIRDLLVVAKEQKEGGHAQLCYTYDWLSFYYYIATDYKNSMFYALEATKHVRDATDSAYLYQLYQRVAVNYKQRGSPAEAIEWNLKAISYMNLTHDYYGLYLVLADLVRDMLPLGRSAEALKIIQDNSRKSPPHENWQKIQLLINLAQVYEALHNYAKAEKHAEELVQLIDNLIKRKEHLGRDYDVKAYICLTALFLNTGKYDRSEMYLQKTMAGWPKAAPIQGREFEHRFRYRLDSARGNYHSAFEHFKSWHKILDSALSVSKAKEFDEIQTAYKTEQKDSLIKLKEQNIELLTGQDLLQKSKLQQGAILRNISLAAAGLSLMIIGLLYNRFRLKKRTNKELEIKQAEIGQQNVTLRRVVDEKEWLLKEIHHRVKNNLQIVMSLLNSQSAYIDNGPALTAIHDSQHRVHAMSLIHQKLYNTENLSSIDMSLYIRELASYLAESFNTDQRIRFEIVIKPLEMDVSQAVPLGLILNEAITNSIKYAFPNDRVGVIRISLSNTSGNQYLLEISDNGTGIPSQLKNKKAGSLGMSLMAGLSEDLDGSFSIENNNGTVIKILFVHDMNVKRPDQLVPAFVTSN